LLLHRPQSIMKKYIFLLSALIIFFSSCEDIQDNDAVIQANIDSLFFKSFGTNGVRTNGGVQMVGLTDDESITLFTSDIQLDSYPLGENSPSFAVFEDRNGIIYTTQTEGASGTITITDRCVSCGIFTGNFQFTAIKAGLDTIFVDKGVFFEVKVPTQEESVSDGTFSATVDGDPFNAILVNAVDSGNSLLISGAIGDRTILIRVPIDIEVGNYPLPASGFQASYSVGTASENAIEGNISVISHDVPNQTITGTFSFETQTYSITGGQFNVTYQ